MVEGYRKGFYADFMMKEETERIHREHSAADKRRQELAHQLEHLAKALRYKVQLEELVERLNKGIEGMGFAERRELLRLLVDEVVHDNGSLAIKTTIPFDEHQLHPVSQGSG